MDRALSGRLRAQDVNEWHKSVKQGAEVFSTNRITAKKAKASLRNAVVCPNVTRRIRKRVPQSTRGRAALLAPLFWYVF